MPDRPRPVLTTTAFIDNIQDGNDKSTTVYSIRLRKQVLQFKLECKNRKEKNRTEKIEELTNELSRYKWDIVGFQKLD